MRSFRQSPFGWRASVALIAWVMLIGCRGESKRGQVVNEPMSARLVGTWQLTLRLERPMSLSVAGSKLPRTVEGRVALLEDRATNLSFEQLAAPTHLGVYVIDLAALGFPPPSAGAVPILVVRMTQSPSSSEAAVRQDSVYIVINPETPRFSLVLTGTFEGDQASGVWVAASLLGGGGSFTLRRIGQGAAQR
jgi:hypothetical protein